jgi:signal transduction histidine kinase
LLQCAAEKDCRGEIQLQVATGDQLSVMLSLNPLDPGGTQAICLIASDLSEVKQAEQELRNSGDQLRNLAARLLSVREEERTRIAREIHDELGQSLTAVKMDVSWLAAKLPPGSDQMIERIRATVKLADDLIKTVRRISTELRPGILDLGLAAAVEWQAQEFHFRTGIACKLNLLAQEVELAPDVSTALFRIFQETLTNIARHAESTSTEVTLETQGNCIVLHTSDNGRGFDQGDPRLSRSLGLLGMRERAAMLGGHVNISSAPGHGTTVIASIPFALQS